MNIFVKKFSQKSKIFMIKLKSVFSRKGLVGIYSLTKFVLMKLFSY